MKELEMNVFIRRYKLKALLDRGVAVLLQFHPQHSQSPMTAIIISSSFPSFSDHPGAKTEDPRHLRGPQPARHARRPRCNCGSRDCCRGNRGHLWRRVNITFVILWPQTPDAWSVIPKTYNTKTWVSLRRALTWMHKQNQGYVWSKLGRLCVNFNFI